MMIDSRDDTIFAEDRDTIDIQPYAAGPRHWNSCHRPSRPVRKIRDSGDGGE